VDDGGILNYISNDNRIEKGVHIMILRRGDRENLVGNAIVYWDVVGDNAIAPGYSVFAINFTVSALALENKLLTATFPPIPMKSADDLFHKLKTIHCDIIYGGELEFPSDQETFTQFYKNEFFKYNKIIEEYVEAYKEKFDLAITQMSEQEKLMMLRELSNKIRIEIREGSKTKKIANTKLTKLMDDLSDQQKYDISNFKAVLFQPGDIEDQLVNLYTNQFLAIYHEDYENASHIKQEINKLETEPDSESPQ